MARAADAEATATAAEARRTNDTSTDGRGPFLYAVLHCDAPVLGGARYSLAQLDEVVIQRGPERHATREETDDGRILFLAIPGTLVSRTHARFKRVRNEWLVVDDGSRNGTFLNGERTTRATLADRDVVECGHTLFVYRTNVPTPEDLAPDRDVANAGATPLVSLVPDIESANAGIARIARSNLPVLFLGASGSGKEVAARALHALSARSGAFVAVNCGALPPTLLESHLFGHVRGAFSGATRDEPGFFRAAHEGTLFLDELGELPVASQAAFLRALEEGAVTPVGTTRPVPVDVRVVAATNRPLDELVASGGFREDLLARLACFTYRLPPLAERVEDLGVLTAALLPQLAGEDAARVAITTDAAYRMVRHHWPLNVRELRHCLAAGLVLAAGQPIAMNHIEPSLARGFAPAPKEPEGDLQARLIAELETHRGNVAAVARAFGKAPAQVHRWLRQYGIDLSTFRASK